MQAAERVLQYVCGTYDQGITYFDPGDETKNKLIGWVDSDSRVERDPDTRKSMTAYLMSLNGGAISWRSSRQGGCPHVHPLLPIESQFCEHHLSRTKPTIYHNVSRRVIGLLFVIYRFEMLGACRGGVQKNQFL